MKQIVIFLLLLLLSLTACTSVTPPYMVKRDLTPIINTEESKALLVVARLKTAALDYGEDAYVNVFLDEVFVGQTMINSYFLVPVEPGVHYIFSFADIKVNAAHISTVKFDFKENRTYFIKHRVTQPPKTFTVFTQTEPFDPAEIDFEDLDFIEFSGDLDAVEMSIADRKSAMREFDENPEKNKHISAYEGY